MAMEIVRAVSLAQNGADTALLKLLGNGKPMQAMLQNASTLPSGDAVLRLKLSGQVLDVRISQDAVGQVKVGSALTLQMTQTHKGPQLTITPSPVNPEGQSAIANAAKMPAPNSNQAETPLSSRIPSVVTVATTAPSSQAGEGGTKPTAYSATPVNASANRHSSIDPLAVLQRQALSQQHSLTALFANLSAMVQQIEQGQRPGISPDVETALRWVLGFQLAPKQQQEAVKTGDALRQLLSSLGFLGRMPSGLGGGAPISDFKSALEVLRSLLSQDLDGAPPLTTKARTDQPPLRGAAPQGQSQQAATVLASDPDFAAFARIKTDIEAALARITLSQIASVRSSVSDGTQAGGSHPRTLHAELPIALAGGTAVVQLIAQELVDATDEDTREGGLDTPSKKRGGWLVNFALNAEPVGPIEATLQLRDKSVHLTLAAEKDTTLSLLRQSAPLLQTMMEAEGLQLEAFLLTEQKVQAAVKDDALVSALPTRLDRTL